MEGRIMEGRIMEGRIMEGRIMEGRIMEGRIMEGRIMEGRIMEGRYRGQNDEEKRTNKGQNYGKITLLGRIMVGKIIKKTRPE